MKYCIKCNMAKNGSNFKNRGNKCKECMKEKKKQYDKQYRKDNEEKIRQYKNEHKNEKIQYDRLRYIKNREQVLKEREIYYNKHREEKIAYRKKYFKTKKGVITKRKSDAKYKRNMKWIPIIDNPFPSNMHVENHHLLNDFYSKEKNCWFVIPLPTVTHNYVGGKTRNKLHWVHNARWIKKIYGIDVKDFLLGI